MHYIRKLWLFMLVVLILLMLSGSTYIQKAEAQETKEMSTMNYARIAGIYQSEADILGEDDFYVIMEEPKQEEEIPQAQQQEEAIPQTQEEAVEETAVSQAEITENLKQSIKAKMANLSITQSSNLSEVIGFTEEELTFALKNAKKNGTLVIQHNEPEKMAEALGAVIAKKANEYQVNELCILGIMSVETGWFNPQKSTYLRKYNNFGGMKTKKGTAINYETWEEGIEANIKCIGANMKGNNTAKEIGSTYCPGSSTWPKQIISAMKTYKKAFETLEIAG